MVAAAKPITIYGVISAGVSGCSYLRQNRRIFVGLISADFRYSAPIKCIQVIL